MHPTLKRSNRCSHSGSGMQSSELLERWPCLEEVDGAVREICPGADEDSGVRDRFQCVKSMIFSR